MSPLSIGAAVVPSLVMLPELVIPPPPPQTQVLLGAQNVGVLASGNASPLHGASAGQYQPGGFLDPTGLVAFALDFVATGESSEDTSWTYSAAAHSLTLLVFWFCFLLCFFLVGFSLLQLLRASSVT